MQVLSEGEPQPQASALIGALFEVAGDLKQLPKYKVNILPSSSSFNSSPFLIEYRYLNDIAYW